MRTATTGVIIESLPSAALTPTIRDEIWQLTQIFYDADRDYVEEKLRARQRTVLLRSCVDRSLVGMASVEVLHDSFEGKPLLAIHTSHVMLLPQYRGQNLLQRLGFRTFIATRLRYPLRPIYWFFDSFSYKSYLLLPRNFYHYWPRFDRTTPKRELDLMHQLAVRAYESDWVPEQGIVKRSGRKRLKRDTAALGTRDITTPELDFFVRRNPGHAEGDMLVCLCPLTLRNWWTAGMRALRRARRSSTATLT